MIEAVDAIRPGVRRGPEAIPLHATVSTTVDVYGHLETEDLIRGMRRAGDRWAVATK